MRGKRPIPHARRSPPGQALLIVVMTVTAVVGYGELHDQITIRICPEYFTIAHPHISDTASLTVLACLWGFLATWWVGCLIGIPLAICARIGSRVPLAPARLLRPLVAMLVVVAACAASSGLIACALYRSGSLRPDPYWVQVIPARHLAGFICDVWTHQASYLCGGISGIWLMLWVWRQRPQPGRPQQQGRTPTP